jgi:HEAT repeat protein
MECVKQVLAVLLSVLAFHSAASAGDDGALFAPMRKETAAILASAIRSATDHNLQLRKENLETLGRVANCSWPQVGSLRFVLVHPKDIDRSREFDGWLIAENEESVTWMTPGWKKQTLAKLHIRKIDNCNRKDMAARIVQKPPVPGDDRWSSEDWGTSTAEALLRYAYLAADCGCDNEAHALIVELFKSEPRGLPALQDDFVGWRFERAKFRRGDFGRRSREDQNLADEHRQLLKTCKELRAAFPESKYDEELLSLIEPLEREAATPAPAFLKKPLADMNQEETIRYWIYQLANFSPVMISSPGGPLLFAGFDGAPTPADRLVAIGPAAISFLVETLEDATPTRITISNDFGPCHDKFFLLRRQDVAFECLERIVGCSLYRTYSNSAFYRDSPKRKAAALALAKAWWSRSKGASQAQMIRNFLALLDTMDVPYVGPFINSVRIQALGTLGSLEGPEAVVADLRKIPEERLFERPTVLERLDPPPSASPEVIARMVAAELEGRNEHSRRKTVAALEDAASLSAQRSVGSERDMLLRMVASYRIQRALLHALGREREASERECILRVLAESPKVWHLPALTTVFDHDADVRARVLAGNIIAQIVGDKQWTDWSVRLETRDAALEVARKLIRDETAPLQVRQAAFDILLAWDSPEDRPLLAHLVPSLIECLGDAGSSKRARAAEALACAGPAAAAAVPALSRALDDKDVVLCAEAAHALGKIGRSAQPAIPALRRVVKSKKYDYWVRVAAAKALLNIDPHPTDLVASLLEVLRDQTDENRWFAADVLGELGPDARSAVPALKEALDSDSYTLRESAAKALQKLQAGAGGEPKPAECGRSHWPTVVLLDGTPASSGVAEALEGRSRRQMLFFLVISCHPEGVQVVKRIKL